MKHIILSFYILFSIIFLTYIFPPCPPFPVPPPDAVRSTEDADTETPLRRAYFTNYTREQIIAHYKAHFSRLVTLELNYPPEDAQTLIRDQTRSYYLEELVHPFRESLFINGFIPQQAKDEIWYRGVHYQEKITIRYVPTTIIARATIGISTLVLIYITSFLLYLSGKKLWSIFR